MLELPKINTRSSNGLLEFWSRFTVAGVEEDMVVAVKPHD